MEKKVSAIELWFRSGGFFEVTDVALSSKRKARKVIFMISV
jgi:hypothetical protein